jgi:hypothetical protein
MAEERLHLSISFASKNGHFCGLLHWEDARQPSLKSQRLQDGRELVARGNCDHDPGHRSYATFQEAVPFAIGSRKLAPILEASAVDSDLPLY